MSALPAYRPVIESWTGTYLLPAPVSAEQLADATGELLDIDRLPTLWDALHLDPTPWDTLTGAAERLVALCEGRMPLSDRGRAHLRGFTGLAAEDPRCSLRQAAEALRQRDLGWSSQYLYNAWQAYQHPVALAA